MPTKHNINKNDLQDPGGGPGGGSQGHGLHQELTGGLGHGLHQELSSGLGHGLHQELSGALDYFPNSPQAAGRTRTIFVNIPFFWKACKRECVGRFFTSIFFFMIQTHLGP